MNKNEVQLTLDDNGQGMFYIEENGQLLGEMVIGLQGKELTVFHTEVSDKVEGKGFAKKMLAKMVTYARENTLKVIPLCPYVHAQFRRHPADYADVWKKEESKID